MRRGTALAKGAVALAALAVMAAGVPWALVHFVGWPLPHSLPTWAQLRAGLTQRGIPDTTLLKALACVVWLAWALLVASLAVETPATIRGRLGRRLRWAGPLQPLAAQLLAAVAIAAISLSARSQAAPRPLHVSLQPASAAPAPALAFAAVDAGSPLQVGGKPPPAPPGAATSSYLVQRNDTLWGIAETRLGDPLRWREIFALNQDRPQPDGSALADPHWIRPGWTLLLPVETAASPPSDPAPRPLAPPPLPARPAPLPAPAERPGANAPSPQLPLSQPPHAGGHSARSATNGAQADADRPPAVVSLPGGAVVSGAFAAGVLSAVAVGRLRRRHGCQPGVPEPGRCLAPAPLGPTIRRLAYALTDEDEGPPAPSLPHPEEAEATRLVPDLIDAAERDGTTITARLADRSGAALVGPQADDVARAWMAALLTRAGPLAAEVMATTATTDRLLPGLGEIPGLRTSTDSASLIRAIEAEILTRTRLLDAAGASDDIAHRRSHPAEPLPALLCLVEDLDDAQAARMAANLATIPRLGITVVFLSDSAGAAGRLHLDGHVVAAAEPTDQLGWLAGASLFAMPATEAVEVLRALADAEYRPTSDDNPEWTEVIERIEHPAPDAEPWPETAPSTRAELPESPARPVRVQAFGPLTITVAGTTISRGLRSVAKELLLYYLLRPEGATVEQAVDHLWPDTDPAMVHRQFWTAASNLRSRFRQHLDVESKILDQDGDVYRLDPDLVSADLWDFQSALAAATRVGGDDEARSALRLAAETYRGELAETAGWIWLEPVREDLHRRAVDAHLRLAELEERSGDLPAAEAVLENVIDLDRYAEEPYRRLMSLQARHGRTGAVKATWRQLQRRLIELDLDPDPATARLYRSLITEEPAA
ncbi:MAG TPA: BTAD domain-containing putative transcriptional regulator [Acidimicrobiales bacterium]|nr:BTAD domain-containing putative transcriptional regulator [Acidimicrobiales bacterium]